MKESSWVQQPHSGRPPGLHAIRTTGAESDDLLLPVEETQKMDEQETQEGPQVQPEEMSQGARLGASGPRPYTRATALKGSGSELSGVVWAQVPPPLSPVGDTTREL